jgi:hypothetical protein
MRGQNIGNGRSAIVDIGDHYGSAFAGEAFGEASAQPLRRTGNDGNAPLKSGHDRLLQNQRYVEL